MRATKRMPLAFAAALCAASTVAPADEPALLEFRKIEGERVAETGARIPPTAVRVFVYEGLPRAAAVGRDQIAVDYHSLSGVLFDRKSGKLARRFTVADGWPDRRPEGFPPPAVRERFKLVGPGVLYGYRDLRGRPGADSETAVSYETVVSAEFGGRLYEALQPVNFLRTLERRVGRDYSKLRESFGSWTGILRTLNEESFVRAEGADRVAVRHTMQRGLAGNIVTHLAAGGGKLWAACVDIYDPERKQWGPGGLCALNPETGRWERLDRIGQLPVRWVTLLQTVGEDLWVGFRIGEGVAGDRVVYGMGLYPGDYGPVARQIALARLSEGKWTTFTRPPAEEQDESLRKAPTERLRWLAAVDGKVFLFSQSRFWAGGDWDVSMAGHISMLDPASGQWRLFDTAKDFGALHLEQMVIQAGEVLAFTGRGARRWSGHDGEWAFLDTDSPILNPQLSAAAAVGEELWIGYNVQSFRVLGRQGISRFDERTLRWSQFSAEQIGTACPVKTIAPLPGGDVWVLFRRRENTAARAEFPLYPSQRALWKAPFGVGRFSMGKWEFPAKLPGVPEGIERQRQGPNGPEKWTQQAPIWQMAAARGKLFVASDAGVFAGPEKWKRILDPPQEASWRFPLAMLASEDGSKLVVIRRHAKPSDTGGPQCERLLYDPETGSVSTSILEAGHENRYLYGDEGLLAYDPGRKHTRAWTLVPTNKPGQWAVGPLDNGQHTVVETPRAVWIASWGQLVRLDRKELAEWLGKVGE